MSELTECYADQAAINERYRTAHRDMAALRARVAVLEEALKYIAAIASDYEEGQPMRSNDVQLILTTTRKALATTEGE